MHITKSSLVHAALAALLAGCPSPPIRQTTSNATTESGTGVVANTLTPVVVAPLGEIHPTNGSDDRTHLVYELSVANMTPFVWTVSSIDALADGDASRALAAYAGADVASRTRFAAPGATLGPNQIGTIFLHVTLPQGSAPPRFLVHRLVVATPDPLPPGFTRVAGLPDGTKEMAYATARLAVTNDAPVVLSPPLEGTGWVAADGCCEAPRHVRALLPIGGRPVVAQRFAIDWERVNDARLVYAGDAKDPKSYFAYGQRAFAVADGRVVTVLDGLPDQVPGKLPEGLPLHDADGNHVVLDVGGGAFVFYAHFAPGTVAVKEGELVKRGQLLGLVGNSGNSSAPHLHLHVMNGAATLASDGRPFVFDAYERRGETRSTQAFDDAEANGTPLEILPQGGAIGRHVRDMPMDRSVLDFPAR